MKRLLCFIAGHEFSPGAWNLASYTSTCDACSKQLIAWGPRANKIVTVKATHLEEPIIPVSTSLLILIGYLFGRLAASMRWAGFLFLIALFLIAVVRRYMQESK